MSYVLDAYDSIAKIGEQLGAIERHLQALVEERARVRSEVAVAAAYLLEARDQMGGPEVAGAIGVNKVKNMLRAIASGLPLEPHEMRDVPGGIPF